jgi:AcrR family transcriptional regulator
MAGDAPPTERPLRRDAQRNREKIIAAGHEVFAVRGFAATLDDVARHAGVGVGTVYRRFPTKESLVQALFAERMEAMADLADGALRAESAWDGIVAFLTALARMHAEDRGLHHAVLSLGIHEFAEVKDRVLTMLDRLITRAQAEGSLRCDVVVTDLPVIFAVVGDLAGSGAGSRPDVYRRYLQLIIDGLRAGPHNGELGAPLSRNDLEAVIAGHVPAIEGRRR